VEAIFAAWPELGQTAQRAVVLCGPGNNGGDGFVVARLLKEWGWEVEVRLHGDVEKLPPDARANYERWCAMGAVAPLTSKGKDPMAADLVVDAVFGTGLGRALADDLMASILGFLPFADLKAKDVRPYVVAIDMPSGLSSDTGLPMPAAVDADLTVSFHREKLGHRIGLGPAFCGRVVVADIGLEAKGVDGVVPLRQRVMLASPLDVRKHSAGHKFSHGHALVLSGGAGRTGAARLAARGALRVGAGLVTLGVPGEAMAEVAAQITAVMLREVVDAAALGGLLQDARLNVLCIGPGLGLGQAAGALVAEVLAAGRKAVLDADALTHIARAPALMEALHGGCVLTPHGGEFARLFPDIAQRLDAAETGGATYSKVEATREAAHRVGCTVLFKGADTVIAAPDGQCVVHAAVYERAAPWLATAGAGDVLAGIIAGLLARGFDPLQAAQTGAWLHVEAARAFGPGVIAEDLPEMLPKVFRDLATL
ncbi:MAG: NAD(P)H-hydrate dehydratase, partial [Rhodobacteraceae bacterium]|nr:NAD(P)H-hydrate dehydratase [Paracoccaceae bacterium]